MVEHGRKVSDQEGVVVHVWFDTYYRAKILKNPTIIGEIRMVGKFDKESLIRRILYRYRKVKQNAY